MAALKSKMSPAVSERVPSTIEKRVLLVVETMSSRVDWKKKRRPSVKPSTMTLIVKVVVDDEEEDGDDVELVEVVVVLVLLVTRVVPLPVGVLAMVEVVVLVELPVTVMVGGGLGLDPGTLLTVKTISVQTDKSKNVVESPAKSETSPATSTQVKKTSSIPFRKQDRLPSSLTTQTILSCSMIVMIVSSD
jgi:hypothetical protein